MSTAAIDLEPGQTTALMAWEASEGQVVGYLVFQSHGDEAFEFLATVATPQVEISGQPGDSVRILVVALGALSSESAASPASPPVRFHAAVETVSAAVTAAPSHAAPILTTQIQPIASETDGTPESIAEPGSPDADAADSTNATDTADGTDTAIAAASTNPTEETKTTETDPVLIGPALRKQLLASNPRFPFAGLSAEAERWIQSFVDTQVGAGVSLAGSGEITGDALRDLVWIDSSGQLFVSEGVFLASGDDLSSTFVEAIRLGTTERFAGLVDFDGDGIGDWVVEDTTTGDVWILRDADNADDLDNEILVEHIAALHPDLMLVGHGDFDGDGRAELLWQNIDFSYRVGQNADELAGIEWLAADGDAPSNSQLLTVADLNGDGLDDLVFRRIDGLLEFALSRSDSARLEFEWTPGPARTAEGLELIATLDFDQDGIAELAWLADGELEIWNLRDVY